MPGDKRNWHRYFGLLLIDFFTDSPFEVELEKDLSLKKQFLDVVVVRKTEGPFNQRLPDGLDDLGPHNLITFKSYQETLDAWTLKELTGHYVNYRKQVSPSMDDLLPEEHFRLYAVSARFPQNLAGLLTQVQQGVYDCRRGTDVIRIVAAGELRQTENNAMLHLFSASENQFRYGKDHYHLHSDTTSTLLHRLFEQYELEGVKMSYTMDDFRKDYVKEHLKDLTPQELREGLSSDQLEALISEKLLERLSPAKRETLLKLLQGKSGVD